jgi:hypothetical protein
MKYSFVMPYYNRPELRFSLDSYRDLYSYRDDLEVIIVEDSKNVIDTEMHTQLLNIVSQYPDISIKVIPDPIESYNPSTKYNLGVKESSGEIIVITNPEVPHISDVLKFIDNSDMDNLYVICACQAVHTVRNGASFKECEFSFYMWYQHTQYRDVRYHFCTVISKDNFINKVKGFNEIFTKGIAYDDDNFVKRVQKSGMILLPVDDLVTYHIEHSRSYRISSEEFNRLTQINLEIWRSQVATDKY